MRVPLFVEFRGKRVLVIGGGEVATKRALKFLRAGAHVRVISLEFTRELLELGRSEALDLIKMGIIDVESVRRHMRWCDMVVIATPNRELNSKLRSIARDMRKLFNDATSSEETDIVVPFEAEVDGIRIAVTTEGMSGIVAKRVLLSMVNSLRSNHELLNMARVWFRVKSELKRRVEDAEVRLRLYSILDTDEEFNKLAREGLVEEALEYALSIVGITSSTDHSAE